FVNLSAMSFDNPAMELAGTMQALLERGWANDVAFGGSGPHVLSSISIDGGYATLVPTSSTLQSEVQITSPISHITYTASGALRENLSTVYVVPEPNAFVLIGVGLAIFVTQRFGRRALPVVRR